MRNLAAGSTDTVVPESRRIVPATKYVSKQEYNMYLYNQFMVTIASFPIQHSTVYYSSFPLFFEVLFQCFEARTAGCFFLLGYIN